MNQVSSPQVHAGVVHHINYEHAPLTFDNQRVQILNRISIVLQL